MVGTDDHLRADQLAQAGIVDVLVDVAAIPGHMDGSRKSIRERRRDRLAGWGCVEVARRLGHGLGGRGVIPALLEQTGGKVRLGQIKEQLNQLVLLDDVTEDRVIQATELDHPHAVRHRVPAHRDPMQALLSQDVLVELPFPGAVRARDHPDRVEVMVLALEIDVVADLGLMGHAPDLGAELGSHALEQGRRPALGRGLLDVHAPGVEGRQRETVGSVGQVPVSRGGDSNVLGDASPRLSEPDAGVETALSLHVMRSHAGRYA